MSTVLQKAIDKFKQDLQHLYNIKAKNSELLTQEYQLESIINHLESLLPEEEKQIREAWMDGLEHDYDYGLETYITNLKTPNP